MAILTSPPPRKTLALASAVAVLALVATACSSSPSTPASSNSPASSASADQAPPDAAAAASITVMDWYTDEAEHAIWDDVVQGCGAEVGVTVDHQSAPSDGYVAKVLQLASSKTLPDILMLDGPDLSTIAQTGALVPLAEQGVSADGFPVGIVDAGSYDGTLYGFMVGAATIALYYNVDILTEAGLTPPTTWQELKDVSAQLTTDDRFGLALAAPASFEGTWQFLPFYWSNGGDEADLTNAGGIEALQLWVDLIDAGSVSKGALTWTQGDVNDQFMGGKAAMMVNGPWNMPSLDASGINYDVVKIPPKQADQDSIAPLGGVVWTLPQTDDEARLAAAAEVLACIGSDKVVLESAIASSGVPTKTTVAEAYLAQRPDMAGFFEQVSTARSRNAKLGAAWPVTDEAIYKAIQAALTHQSTPAEAFAAAKAEVG